MDEIYQFLKDKISEMHETGTTCVTMDFAEIAQLYQMVCFFKQVRTIVNGMEK